MCFPMEDRVEFKINQREAKDFFTDTLILLIKK